MTEQLRLHKRKPKMLKSRQRPPYVPGLWDKMPKFKKLLAEQEKKEEKWMRGLEENYERKKKEKNNEKFVKEESLLEKEISKTKRSF